MGETGTHTAQQDWTWTQTPDPLQKIFTVFVSTQKIRVPNEETGDPGNMPTREVLGLGAQAYVAPTKFKDLHAEFGLRSITVKGVANWEFTGETIMADDRTAFHFFRPKTSEQMAIPWSTKRPEGNHHWDTVVLRVWTETDYSMPQSANTVDFAKDGTPLSGIIVAPTVRIRSLELPQIEEGSIIVTRRFMSSRQPLLNYHPVPQPMNMDVQVNGASRLFERVLHDLIVVEATLSGTRQILSNGEVSDVGGVVGSQSFEATNFTARKPYIVSDDFVQDAYGVWQQTQIEVIPPKLLPVEN